MVKAISPLEIPGMAPRNHQRLFGNRVKALRKARSLSQEELAEAIGKSVDTISNIERGFNSTRISTVFDIADALHVSFVELFDWVPSRKLSAAEERHEVAVGKFRELLSSERSPTFDDIAGILAGLKRR